MSLIQDALKRKREEEQFKPPGQETPPPEAGTQPPAMDKEPKRDADKRLFILISVITVIVLILLGAVKLLRSGDASAEVEPVKPTAVVEAPISLPPPVIEKEPEPKPEPGIQWPELKLTGFATGAGQRLIILNGKMLAAGRELEGVRIVQVGRNEVVVEYKGEQRILRVDDE